MASEMNIGIVGAGRMGVGIATAILLAARGYRLELVDIKPREPGNELAVLQKAYEGIESNLRLLHELGELTVPVADLLADVTLTSGLSNSLADCTIVFEALPEKPEIKQKLISSLEPLLGEQTIIASATSTISLDAFWQVSQRPQNIIITHWLNPAFIIPLVEIAIGDKTADQVVERTRDFLVNVGKVPVTLKNSPGFILPRIQTAAMNEAVRILEEGIASAEDIDTAVKAGFGFRLAGLGLIEFIDLGGVDILFHASNYLYAALGQPQFKLMNTVNQKMQDNQIGPKTGKGFFNYSDVDTDEMFKDRYRGFQELLNLVKRSNVLSFQGGIRDNKTPVE
jgi:3-hydroxybutyryl-CoA dehydrogenase